ncbi:hypothetical protein GCM10010317_020560 [Streptomyces mirabilis]|uniref:hypothetical protein n=1 Tax=Streptomyces mirabilis TaxID=68239 RepID=UPI0019844C90|nr:hypothetical protein [Streptomyces mirabilis]GHD45727.1 hypothetical protein GCM10010317_020560 [Streptomyces mirabilis]
MTPRQTVVMVVTSVVMTGLGGGAVGVPLDSALHGWIRPAMGHSARLNLPESVIAVYRTPELVLLALGGLLIAVLGTLLPAGWAARTRSAVALRTEQRRNRSGTGTEGRRKGEPGAVRSAPMVVLLRKAAIFKWVAASGACPRPRRRKAGARCSATDWNPGTC